MNRLAHHLFRICLALTCAGVHVCAAEMRWSKLPSIPDKEGFAGSFAGVSGGALIVAGGANMVGDKWGTKFHKQWYDSVFVLDNPQSQWRVIGKLPRPLGYGVSITTDEGVICVGGSDATKHYAEVFQLSWKNGALRMAELPALPKACANFCGAKVGQTIYVAGGLESPNATRAMQTFWALDLSKKKLRWKELPAWPGPDRMLAVAGILRDEFYLVSGARLKVDANGKTVREYLKDAYAYSSRKGWRRIADLPHAVVAAPSPGISEEELLIISGDDGSKVSLQPSPSHPGFPHDVLGYDVQKNEWSIVGQAPFGRATSPVVQWKECAVVVMGEVRPRERTTEVWCAEVAR